MSLLDNPKPVIAIIGVGAVGGFYGAKLIAAGHDVHLLLRSDYDAVAEHGLKIHSIDGDFSLPPARLNIHRDPRDMPQADLVLIALKATSNDAFIPLISPLLNDRSAILTIQNGLGNEDRLAELFGAARVMGGMAFVCLNRTAPGVIQHIDHGFLKIGEFAGTGAAAPGVSARVQTVADHFQKSGVRCDALPDLRLGRWEKLVWNIPFNGFGALLDLTTDRLIHNQTGVSLISRLMREVIAIAVAEGVALQPNLVDSQITHTQTMGPYQTSMQIDRRNGRAIEIEAILGEPLRRAQRLEISVPTLTTLYEMLRLIAPSQQ